MQYIGVVRLDRIGDTVLTLPAIKILRKNYPDHKIVGIFNQYNSELFVYNDRIIHPYFDIIEILNLDLSYQRYHLAKLLNFLRIWFWNKKNKYNFDKLFVFSPTTVSYLLGYLLKANKRYTYFYGSRLNKQIFKKRFVYYIDEVDKSMMDDSYEFRKVRHEIYQNLEVVKLDLDFEIEQIHNYLPELFLPEMDFEKYDLLVFDKELFFGNQEGVNWLKIFVENLFKEIEKTLNKALKKAFVSKRKDVFDFSINPNIIELMGIIRNSACVICFDSGIVHIASAFDKKMVVIFGNRYFEFDIRRWGPLSTNNKILKLNIFNEEGVLDFDLTNPVEFASYVAYNAKDYIP